MRLTINTTFGEIDLDIDITQKGYTIPGDFHNPDEYVEPKFEIEKASPVGFKTLVIDNLSIDEKECYLQLLKICNNLQNQDIASEDYEKIIDLIERN